MSRLLVWDGSQWVPNFYVGSARVQAVSASATVTSVTSIPSSGTSFNILFTVKTTAGAGVSSGSAQAQYLNGSTWTNSGAAVTMTGSTGNYTASVSQSATRQWRIVYTAAGAYTSSTSSTYSVAYQTLTTFTKTYACSGSGTYDGDGSKRTDSGHMYQGYYSSTHGIQRSMAIFPTTIQTDLAGAYDIQKVEVYLNCLHWGPDSGGTVEVCTHNNTSVPAAWGSIASLAGYDATAWTTKTGAKWCDISSIMGSLANWQSGGTKKGIALYFNSTALEYYGYFSGNGETGEPQLRITYRKYV